jgi:large subunit ribosomal protein L23
MQLNKNDIILRPILTEKSTEQRKGMNKYSFEVNSLTNKTEAKRIIEKMFNVKVLRCNVINKKGKLKRYRATAGYKADRKKVIVTLAPGSKIDFFEGF